MPRIKGSHTAMKSAMLAAEAAFDAIAADRRHDALDDYEPALRVELDRQGTEDGPQRRAGGRRVGAGRSGTLFAGVDMWLNFCGIGMPWTLKHHADHDAIERKEHVQPIDYPKPDGVLTFDRLSSVFLSNTNHEEDQPVHLTLKDADVPITVNLALYDGPEQRYCPAGVYEFVEEAGSPRLQINAQNCVHCKTCDIKDPTQNINWVAPEGGGGPNYPNM